MEKNRENTAPIGFSDEVLAIEPELIEARRWLHAHAEVSFEEYETTAWLEAELKKLDGITIDRPTKTGLVAHLHGTKAGTPAVLGIRADIDALPMPEYSKLPFASLNEGVMHACAHDGHAAILLTAAKCLSRSRDSFCGEVRFFFQHAEELPPGGAIEMVRAGAADGVDTMLSLHLSSNFPTGAYGIRPGILTSNVDAFYITVRGKGGHCAFPELSVDPVVAAAQLVLSLQTIVSRRMAAIEPAVISVCEIKGGTAYNIIPDEVKLSASVRSFGEASRAKIEQEVRRIAEGVAESYGVTCEIDYQEGYPSVINDEALTELAEATVLERFPASQVLHIDRLMPGEDYAYFVTPERPGFFMELGSGNAEKGCAAPHHNSNYRLDEDALRYGLQFELDMVRTLLDGTRTHIDREKNA